MTDLRRQGDATLAELGSIVKAAREREFVDQRNTEIEQGWGSGFLSKLESGGTAPSPRRLREVADALNMTSKELDRALDLLALYKMLESARKLASDVGEDRIAEAAREVCASIKRSKLPATGTEDPSSK